MYTGKLLSGVEFQVKELTGKQERILTEDSKASWLEKMNAMLASSLVRVGDYYFGSNEKEDTNFLQKMYLEDRKKVLVDLRQYSLDFQEVFKFVYDYTTHDGKKESEVMELPMTDGTFPFEPIKVRVGEELLTMEQATLQATGKESSSELTYEDVLQWSEYEIILPRTGQTIKVQRPNGLSELRMTQEKKGSRSSHSAIKLRNPRKLVEGTSVQLNLDTLPQLDLIAMRDTFKALEGKVDTEIQFEHPEAEFKRAEEKMVVQDVIASVAFFFPSGVI